MGLGTKVEYFEADYNELDSMVKEIYGVDLDFCADQEVSNDSSHSFSIDGKIDEYDARRIEEFKSGKYTNFVTLAILNDMCRNGHIQPGDYLINVSW